MVSKRELLKSIRQANRQNIEKRVERMLELMQLLDVESIWDLYPNLYMNGDSQNLKIQDALGELTQAFWHQALRCYIDSSYIGCVILSSAALETALKFMLVASGVENPRYGLGTCITRCIQNNIFPPEDNEIVIAANSVNQKRNDIIHANIARERPDSVIYSDGPEHSVRELGHGFQEIGPFQNAAKDILVNTKMVLDYFIHDAAFTE
ncbi:hypothetical protein ES703_20048 [subsurface metagenome]